MTVGKKSFMVAMDLGVFTKFAADVLLDECLEFVDCLLFVFGAQSIPVINVSGIFQHELECSEQFGTLSPFHDDFCSIELVQTMEELMMCCIDRNNGKRHLGSLRTVVGGHGWLEADCCEVSISKSLRNGMVELLAFAMVDSWTISDAMSFLN